MGTPPVGMEPKDRGAYSLLLIAPLHEHAPFLVRYFVEFAPARGRVFERLVHGLVAQDLAQAIQAAGDVHAPARFAAAGLLILRSVRLTFLRT